MADISAWQVKPVANQQSLSGQIAQQLQALICEGQIAVGDKLPTESELCDLFGVSRTAVREAIAHLRSMGLIETRRGVGTRVLRKAPEQAFPARRINATTVEDILHVLELRLTIEPQAAALAARRHTSADAMTLEEAHRAFIAAEGEASLARSEDYLFHHAIIEAAHNPFLLAFYEPLHTGAIPRAQLLDSDVDPVAARQYLAQVGEEHGRILQAILARDEQGARNAMNQHLERATRTYSAYQTR
ncbi:FadR/GntR family transcriptional regulator [Larsenimonas rhizosphaerae]|uniref:FadR/GntR family transcriptional regulator n=1 Tax=Larsenimonas rhizosphaerae TaxID=2944682 RepID=A0AA41ZH26_9GAMM|nr:FadR/GntR family transcriptional regulator [Larsenimonas rhizosphaerae]MCX2524425.1 FadR/GntR family transcriptional regulator [Larsenimonas rhizosphaerae]